jgi:hypothetical protein
VAAWKQKRNPTANQKNRTGQAENAKRKKMYINGPNRGLNPYEGIRIINL